MGVFMQRWGVWLLAWLLLAGSGMLWIARTHLLEIQQGLEADARIAHRLLSQRMVQHEALLSMLALLQPTASTRPEQRLSAIYPQVTQVLRRPPEGPWTDEMFHPGLRAAEDESRKNNRPTLAEVDFVRGRYQLVQSAAPSSFALEIDLRSTIPWNDWPMLPQASPVQVSLGLDGQNLVVQPGSLAEDGWRFEFRKPLASPSQPFEMIASRQVSWWQLPWPWMAAWAFGVAAALAGLRALLRQRTAHHRAQSLLELNAAAYRTGLGELAAGVARTLAAPLSAVRGHTQTAGRLLRGSPSDLVLAQNTLALAVEQAGQASDTVEHIRRTLDTPPVDPREPVILQEAVQDMLHLLEPECQQRGVTPTVRPCIVPAITVQANPTALAQILQQLLMNALQALEAVPADERQLVLSLDITSGQGVLTVSDSGTGIHAGVMQRIFEPFFSTRAGSPGLGLGRCESLAMAMGGTLTVSHRTPRGACFHLALPLADATLEP